ncbi:MAG: hypothetical protein CM15mP18_2130 [Methanobacteriota archaeon]|nr:MAG: hypothetical protein CM15mP18_2130 [Euryarchaeota archaeon]
MILSLGYYVALAMHLSAAYVDDPYNTIVLWPILVGVVLPCLVGVVLHRLGASDLRHLRAAGMNRACCRLGSASNSGNPTPKRLLIIRLNAYRTVPCWPLRWSF